MKILDHIQVLEALAGAIGKPCMYVSFWSDVEDGTDYDEICKAAPYLSFPEHVQVLGDGSAIIVCEDDAEMGRLYRQTVGDDGPTETTPYRGPARVYALTCGADGHTQNENT